MIVIGIDCGTHTGFAWGHTELESVGSLSLHRAFEKAHEVVQDARNRGLEHLFVIEDARLRKWYGSRGHANAQGVGSVKRDSSAWEEFCKDYGYNYKMVHPQKGGTKWSAVYFKRVTGWAGRTNEHGRDAGVLAFTNMGKKARVG